MKFKLTVILATFVVTMGLLLGASAASGAVPEPATLISPSGTITDNTPTYTWNAVSDSTWYRLWVWDSIRTKKWDQWYTADEAGCSVGTGECSVTPETMMAGDSHEWWIQTWNDDGDGDWSDKLSFTVSPAPVPRTGQTQSYYPGDDGDLQKGVAWPVPRFTDNGDQTVTDNLTGLVWHKCGTCAAFPWDGAMDLVSECEDGELCTGDTPLSDGSQTGDWRLPNRRELESVMDFSRSTPALPVGHPFDYDEERSRMWTSTTYPGYEGQGAWFIDMNSGEIAVAEKKTALRYIWPVRDGN